MSALQQAIQDRLALQQQQVESQRAQLQQMQNQPQEIDYSALINLADTWTGSNLSRAYQRPETAQERQYKAAMLEQGLQRAEGGILDDQIKLLQLQERQKQQQIKSAEKSQKKPKLTSDQWKVATFGRRMDDANKQMQNLYGDEGSEKDPTSFMSGLYRKFAPEAVKPESIKKQSQAERNFVNAVLRRESGAAISPSEFESAELQYFPRVGDTADVIEQKRLNRERAIEGFKLEAGDAWSQFSEKSGSSKSRLEELRSKMRAK